MNKISESKLRDLVGNALSTRAAPGTRVVLMEDILSLTNEIQEELGYGVHPATIIQAAMKLDLELRQRTTKVTRDNAALDRQVGGDHYKNFEIQPVEFIEKNKLGFLEGCMIKRLCRHGDKNGAEDLRKVIHEAELLISLRYGENP